MRLEIISVTPLQLFVLFLLRSAEILENKYVKNDSIYSHTFNHGEIECHYFAGGLEVCVFKGAVMVKRNSEVKCVHPKPLDPIGVMVYKYAYEDPSIPGYKHKLRIYSNGVVIHTSAAFNYIYNLNPFRRRTF